MRAWQAEATVKPAFEGWVGHLGYGVTLEGNLRDIALDEQGMLRHEVRVALDTRARLLEHMRGAPVVDEAILRAYLRPALDEVALHDVIIPLLRAYTRDPDLLRRYNYGRGQWNVPLSEPDMQRVKQARSWLEKLARQGYTPVRMQELANEIPLIGAYAAFAGYMRMLATLV